jgi:hypothetical protein
LAQAREVITADAGTDLALSKGGGVEAAIEEMVFFSASATERSVHVTQGA